MGEINLSMHSEAVFKGGCSDNGMLLKLHENSFTIGYSALSTPDGKESGTVKFGNGVFVDASQKNNHAYVGSPTMEGAVPVFAGIMVREPAIASAYPVTNDEVSEYQMGLLCVDGYVEYKKGTVVGSTTIFRTGVKLFDYVYRNFVMWVNSITGEVYFSPDSTTHLNSGDIRVGRIVEVNPDGESVTVKISSDMLADTRAIESAVPVVTAGDVTADTINYNVSTDIECTVLMEAESVDTGFIITSKVPRFTVYNPDTDKYECSGSFSKLLSKKAYIIRATTISACGAHSSSLEITTL